MSIAIHVLRGAVGVTAVLAMLTAAAPSRAENLSDMLNKRIEEAQRAESDKAFDDALKSYAIALHITADTPQAKRMVLKKRAALYEQIKMLDLAEADLTAAFKIEPFDAKVYADRGYFYLRQGRHKDALSDFIDGSRADPKNAAYLYGAGRVLVAAQDDANAIKFFNEALEIAPRDPKPYLARAESYLRLHKYQDAGADYDKAFELGLTEREQRYFGFVGRGYVSLMLANFGMAVKAFNRALDLAPDAPNVLLLRGYAYERKGERDLALADYERAAQGMPDLAQARTGVARLRSQMVSSAGTTGSAVGAKPSVKR
jgi:tetratricopeptide (TPR) repeat protein